GVVVEGLGTDQQLGGGRFPTSFPDTCNVDLNSQPPFQGQAGGDGGGGLGLITSPPDLGLTPPCCVNLLPTKGLPGRLVGFSVGAAHERGDPSTRKAKGVGMELVEEME
ncbi:unnamed protein product, partial [Discosporangium mesarthrocarpum]